MKVLKKGMRRFLAVVSCIVVCGVIVGVVVGVDFFLKKGNSNDGNVGEDLPSLVVLMQDSRVYYKSAEHLAAGKEFDIKVGYEDKNGVQKAFSKEEVEREIKFQSSDSFLEVKEDGEMVVKEDKFTDPYLSKKAYPVTIKISSLTNSYKPTETTVNVVPCPTSHIQLDGNGQTLDKEIVDVWEGEKLSEGGFPEAPEIENYTFAGWYRVENGVVDREPVNLDTRYYFGDEMTLRARWRSNLPIELKTDGLGEDIELGVQYYNENLPTLPSLDEVDGWTFGGWYTGIAGAGDLIEGDKPYTQKNLQLYALWTGSISIDPLFQTKQEIPSSIPVTYHKVLDFPVDPEYNNNGKFVGWYNANGDQGTEVLKGDSFLEKNISQFCLFAKVKFPISFDWKDATPAPSGQDEYYAVYNGSMQSLRYFLPKPQSQSENGWNWNGWFIEKDGELIDFSETSIYQTAGPLHLVCTRTSQFTLHSELNGDGVEDDQIKSVKVYYGEDLPLEGLSKLEATNWDFGGYYTLCGGGGTALYPMVGDVLGTTRQYKEEGGLTLFAKWTTRLTLRYTMADVTIDHSQTEVVVSYRSVPQLPILTYTINGKFSGWYTDKAGGGKKIDSNTPYTEEGGLTLYDAVQFTISRDFQDEKLNAQEARQVEIFYGQAINYKSIFPDYKEKQGWEFDGWHSLSTPSGVLIQLGDTYMLTDDLEAFAWWKSNLSFCKELEEDGSHASGSFAQITVHYNQPFSVPEENIVLTSSTGWEFCGFYTEVGGGGDCIYTKEGVPAEDVYLGDGGIALYAKWISNSIKLNNHGFKTTEKIPTTLSVVYNALPNLPHPIYAAYATEPEKKDGEFSGWYTTYDYAEGNLVAEDVPYVGAPDSTFYAKIVFKVQLNYMDADLKDPDPTKRVDTLDAVFGRTYEESNGGNINLPQPQKKGWNLSGWYVEGFEIDGQAVSITPQMRYDLDFAATLYARWTTQFTLMREIGESGRIDDGSYSLLTVEYKKDVTLPTLEADGWDFAGWYEMAGGQGNGYGLENLTLSEYEGETGRTLYAKWKTTMTSENFETFLDTVSGTNLTKEVVYKGKIGELPSPSYQNSGAAFLGWNFDAHMEGRDVEAATLFHYPKDIKFYAKVGLKLKIVKEDVTNQEIEEEYEVLYNAKIGINGKLPMMENTSVWDFAGYYTGEYGEGELITDNTIFVDKLDKTIYAKWEAEIVLSYVITAYSIDEKIPVVYGRPLELPHDVSIGAWHLSGWYTNRGYGGDNLLGDADLTSRNTKVGRTTLYAQWKADITLDPREGANSTKITTLTGVVYNISLSAQNKHLPNLDEMTRTDYVFSGWYADLHEAEAFDDSMAMVNGTTSQVTDDTTEYPVYMSILYAKWAPGSAYVMLHPNNNGGSVQKIQVYVGQPMPEVDAPIPQTASGSEPLTFVGYFFHPKGSAEDKEGAIQYYAPAGDRARSVRLWDRGTGNADNPTDLYAHWENMFVVTWMLDDEETILETDNVQKPGGTIGAQHPVYDQQTLPVKESTPQYDYEFIGWKIRGDPAHEGYMLETELSDGKYTYSEYNITCSIRLIAVFEPKIRSYTVTWLNDDGSQLGTDTVVYGTQPTYTTPTKEQTPQYSYEFAGWKGTNGTLHEGALDPVTGDVTYRAQYNSKIRSYTVTWKNWNDDILCQLTLNYGTDPAEKYTGPKTPTREKTSQYEYNFSGWSPSVTAVTGNITYIAQYNSVTCEYTVTWMNGSSRDTTTVKYGEHPTHDDAVRSADGYIHHIFDGWAESESGPAVELNSITITGNKTLYAIFHDEDKTPPPKECLVTGTLVTLADGSKVPVETLTGDEIIRVWDFENGCIAERPILFVAHKAENTHPIVVRVIHLTFSDGTYLEIVGQEGFWDVDRNLAAYINEGNYSEYIGDTFKKLTENGWEEVQLISVEFIVKYTNFWTPIPTEHMAIFANDLLVFPGQTKIFNNILEVDADTMKYDEAKMQADIEKYGLYTCEEFLAQFPIPESFFKAFDVKYLKIAFGKGLITWEDIIKLVEENGKYLLFG